MRECWRDAVVTRIALAIYVEAGVGRHVHENRPSHGFVLNDEDAVKDYCFSDGTVMRTNGGDFFYLPKGSSYYVKTIQRGGCYAINFDAALSDTPFVVHFRNTEPIRRVFKDAEREWRRQSEHRHLSVTRAVYDLILRATEETTKPYVPGEQSNLIAPALERIRADFLATDLSVESLATLCGISDVYFRKIFRSKMGVSPKEYVIALRIGYAKQLLESGQFSISETASMCGYYEPCHFSREFKKRVGVSPTEYKETWAVSKP